jgi:hypothetical protein
LVAFGLGTQRAWELTTMPDASVEASASSGLAQQDFSPHKNGVTNLTCVLESGGMVAAKVRQGRNSRAAHATPTCCSFVPTRAKRRQWRGCASSGLMGVLQTPIEVEAVSMRRTNIVALKTKAG